MRIALVSQWYRPEPGVVVPGEMAQQLKRLGHDVEVLTGFPNYPSGRLLEGYPLRPRRVEVIDEIVVNRAPLIPSHNRSALGRVANYLSFASAATALSAVKMREPDVWLTYSSPATAALPGMLGRRRSKARHCIVIQDLWPDSVTNSGFIAERAMAVVERSLDRFCSAVYSSSDGIGVISPGMRETLVARGVPNELIWDTPNWADDSTLLPSNPPSTERKANLGLPTEGVLFMYAGNIGELQDLSRVVEAFAQLSEHDAQLVIIGSGIDKENVSSHISSPNVHLRDPVPAEVVGEYLAAADCLVVSLRDLPLLRVTMPSKVQTSLAAARPILAVAPGDVANLVRDSGCGQAAAGDPASIAGSAMALVNAGTAGRAGMGAAARRTYESNFTAEAGSRRLEAMLLASLER